MIDVDLSGRLILNAACPTLVLQRNPEPPIAIEAIHASRSFPAAHEEDRHREHSHDVFHLVAPVTGDGAFLVDGHETRFRSPCVFLLDPFVPHSFAVGPRETVEYHEFTFAVRGDRPPLRWADLLGSDPPKAPIPISPDDTAFLDHLIAGTTRLLASARPDPAAAAAYAAMLMTWARERRADDDTDKGSARTTVSVEDDALLRAREHILMRYTEPFGLDELAASVGLSEKHLCRAFAARFGVPPIRMKRDAAMRGAARLLAGTRYPIKAVAAMVGYQDLHHFSKTFRAWSGSPPGRYRAERSAAK
jgi:AraC-like DNA-binding protein